MKDLKFLLIQYSDHYENSILIFNSKKEREKFYEKNNLKNDLENEDNKELGSRWKFVEIELKELGKIFLMFDDIQEVNNEIYYNYSK